MRNGISYAGRSIPWVDLPYLTVRRIIFKKILTIAVYIKFDGSRSLSLKQLLNMKRSTVLKVRLTVRVNLK